MAVLIQIVLTLMAVFLILIILVQRGRGGGLAGALGGPGGSSAFGAKAGDAFTKITMWTAGIWILLCILASVWGARQGDSLSSGDALSGLGSSSVIETDDDGSGGDADTNSPDDGE